VKRDKDKTEEHQRVLERHLVERVKALQCLYGIASINERPGITLDEIYQETVELLPPAWQYPEVTCAQLTIDGKEFKTTNYRETEWKQSTDIKLHGIKTGTLLVGYLGKRPASDEGPFLREERLLIDAVAERLGRITERIQAEASLRIYSEIISNMLEGVYLIGANDGIIRYTNPRFDAMFGYKRGELVGKHVSIVNAPTDRSPEEVAQEIIRQLDRDGVWCGDVKNIRKNGTIFWNHAEVTEFENPEFGKVWISVHANITERKQMEDALQLERDKLTSILNSMEDGVCIMNQDFGVEYINPSMQSQYGNVDKQKCYQYFNGRDDVCPWCNNKDVLGGKIVLREVQSNKTGRTYDVTDGLLKNADGSVSKLAVWHDITEHKKIEQLKDEFIGMVSHELKTPLTVILGALSTATDERVSHEQSRELIGDAIVHSEILASLVDNLLELSRQQSGRLTIQTQPVNVKEIAQNVIKKLQSKSAMHRLSDDLAPGLSPVLADQLRVERILYNLIDNAIKYSPNGGEVRVSARQEGDFMVVSVMDNGPGISVDDQARLFQSFERLGAKVNGSTQGTGLGLRVCRILVEAHGGRIWVKSDKGKGSTFFFTVPTARS